MRREIGDGAAAMINILLVEDNLLNQLMASRIISQWGLAVTIANHGKEALKLIRKKPLCLY